MPAEHEPLSSARKSFLRNDLDEPGDALLPLRLCASWRGDGRAQQAAAFAALLDSIYHAPLLAEPVLTHPTLADLDLALHCALQADKDILEHIVHDFRDTAMMEALRPSIEEALPINSQDLALDYIGKRGSSVGVTRAKRLEYARDILQKEMLPHVGIAPGCETRKARDTLASALLTLDSACLAASDGHAQQRAREICADVSSFAYSARTVTCMTRRAARCVCQARLHH